MRLKLINDELLLISDNYLYYSVDNPVLIKEILEYDNHTKELEKVKGTYITIDDSHFFVEDDVIKRRNKLLRRVIDEICAGNIPTNISLEKMLSSVEKIIEEEEAAYKKHQEEVLKQLEADRIKRERQLVEAEKMFLLKRKKDEYISKLNKKYDSKLIETINKAESVDDLYFYDTLIEDAVKKEEIRKKEIIEKKRKTISNKLRKIGIDESNHPNIFKIEDVNEFKKEANKLYKEQIAEEFIKIMGFNAPKNIDQNTYIISMDKRLYTDTITKYKKAFDIVDVNIAVCCSNASFDEKLKWVKENQKDIIKYTYFEIFKKYSTIDSFFPIKFIKPTVYKAHGIKSINLVELNIIFELKQLKKKGDYING